LAASFDKKNKADRLRHVENRMRAPPSARS
jgi:hypothetical protein